MNEREFLEAAEAQNRYSQILQKELEEEKLRSLALHNGAAQRNNSYNIPQQENLVELQLNPEKILETIKNSIASAKLVIEDGNEFWVEPDDDRLKIFSEYGIHLIMNLLRLYVNPNTLLSNYNPEQVNWKVRDFGIELADLIFNRYEVFFYYPSPEELYEKYRLIAIKHNLQMTEQELYTKCVQWSKEELQSKFRHYPSICLGIIDVVHSTYLRALNGEERESMRKFMHVSQNVMPNPNLQNKPTSFNIFKPKTWGGGS